MGLVDGQQVDRQPVEQGVDARGEQGFRGNVEQLDRPAGDIRHVLLVGFRAERAVEEQRRHPGGAQLLDLVFHQGDQRRDHHGQAGEEQRRDLVAQRLAPAGGHHRQGIFARQHVVDHLALVRAEGVVAEGVFEDGSGGLHACIVPAGGS